MQCTRLPGNNAFVRHVIVLPCGSPVAVMALGPAYAAPNRHHYPAGSHCAWFSIQSPSCNRQPVTT